MNKKYKPYPIIDLPERKWPGRTIQKAPIWCSVDLRDGNQALIEPMSVEDKLDFFKLLVDIGFKEIEIGFPSASQTEFDFVRTLVDKKMIPEGVSVQVLVQAREHLIERTMEALQGIKDPIVHIYNSTSIAQRKIVFQKEMKDIIEIAIQGIKWIKQYSAKYNTPVRLEYSPESFTGTELENARDICNAVVTEWGQDKGKVIINLPATVEMSSPNVFADSIEWMSRSFKNRENIILSVHAHNDRGCAVAATELALLAGADRVEGTLFGNGERTGNLDVVNLALNMFSHGVDPGLDFSNLPEIKEKVEKINQIPISVRHPYAGDLVFTAFSGSHQDAIKKGLVYQKNKPDALWEVPYLPIDPADIGRTYEGIIRINSQSGKGGVAYRLEKDHGYILPKAMHPNVSKVVQKEADLTGKEVSSKEILNLFRKTFINISSPITLKNFVLQKRDQGEVEGWLDAEFKGINYKLQGLGNGPIDACSKALLKLPELLEFEIKNYTEHSLAIGSTSKAVAYIEIISKQNKSFFGIGEDTDIEMAAVRALISAVNLSENS